MGVWSYNGSILATMTDDMVPYSNQNDSNRTSSGRDESLAMWEIGIQASVFFLAAIGNGIVMVALRAHSKKITRMHYFIFHLSMADILVAFFNILPQLFWDVTYRFQGGDVLCRIVKYLQVFVMYLSTYILVMTSIDRYMAICKPFTAIRSHHKHARRMILISWALSLAFATPQIFIFKIQTVANDTRDCWASFEPEWTVKVYIWSFTVMVYFIPLLVLIFTYGQICYTVWGSLCSAKTVHTQTTSGAWGFHSSNTETLYVPVTQSRTGSPTPTKSQFNMADEINLHNNRISEAKMKTVRLTFVVIIAYIICWSPFFVAQLLWLYSKKPPLNNSAFVISLLLPSLNSCCNPWIYLVFSKGLIRLILPCTRRRPISFVPPKNEHQLCLTHMRERHREPGGGDTARMCKRCNKTYIVDIRVDRILNIGEKRKAKVNFEDQTCAPQPFDNVQKDGEDKNSRDSTLPPHHGSPHVIKNRRVGFNSSSKSSSGEKANLLTDQELLDRYKRKLEASPTAEEAIDTSVWHTI